MAVAQVSSLAFAASKVAVTHGTATSATPATVGFGSPSGCAHYLGAADFKLNYQPSLRINRTGTM